MARFSVTLTLLLVLGVTSSIASPAHRSFRPTRNGGQTSELFWYPTDDGKIVPALLHGKPTYIKSVAPHAIEDDVQFYLYNSYNPNSKEQIAPNCTNCLVSFKRGAPVLIFAHGFTSSHEGGFGDGLRTDFQRSNTEYNLIFVDWSKLAAAPWYEFAADSTAPVGEYTGMLVQFLVQNGWTTFKEVHFIGHSLGAHVGNYVGKSLKPEQIARITAMDPALPLFGEKTDEDRIDPSDAEFVDVIHTAMGTLLDGGLAFTEPRGHADFYPNSGKHQPGCGIDSFGACSHGRSHEYFGESAGNLRGFVGCECSSWEDYVGGCSCLSKPIMGLGTPSTTRGVFYLTTYSSSPFAQG